VFKPPVRVTAPVNVLAPVTARVVDAVTAPVAANVPVTVAPALVTATTVFTPESNERLPLESAVVITPPPPVVTAAIVEAIYISLYP
jgi:hypothetical protein